MVVVRKAGLDLNFGFFWLVRGLWKGLDRQILIGWLGMNRFRLWVCRVRCLVIFSISLRYIIF